MKNLSKIIMLLLVLCGYNSFSQEIPKQVLIVSSSTELSMTFIPTTTFKAKNDAIFKDKNFDTFFEIKKVASTNSKLSYSFDKIEAKGKIFIVKTIYDLEKIVISISVSGSDSKILESKIISTLDLSNRVSGCNRYKYSLEGCWNAFVDWITN